MCPTKPDEAVFIMSKTSTMLKAYTLPWAILSDRFVDYTSLLSGIYSESRTE